jgi:hypothetical protein
VRWALAGVLGAELLAFVLRPALPLRTLELECVTIPLFLLAVLLLSRAALAPRPAVFLVLGMGVALQIAAMTIRPASSDDAYRYAWDAKVQLAGIDPYRYAPAAPQLAGLRDSFFFPDHEFPGHEHCAWPLPDGSCSAINRPGVHTVYPPVAQAAFALIRLGSFGHGGLLPLQLAAALGAVVVAWLLARRALALGRPVWTVALWAWCPVTVVELGNNAHLDWLAVLLAVLALQSAQRPGLAGSLAGAAAAVKLYPMLILPSLLRRRPVLVVGAAVAVIVLAYLPHVVAVGGDVIGFLPGYLDEESGSRNLLLRLLLPGSAATLAAVLLLLAATLWAARRGDPDAPERTAVVIVGAALLVATPEYGWYALLLLALVAMTGAIEWLPLALAPSMFYLIQGDFGASRVLGQLLYGVALILVLAGYAARTRLAQDSAISAPIANPTAANQSSVGNASHHRIVAS